MCTARQGIDIDKDGYHVYDTDKKLVEYEALIRDLTEALRVLPERNAVLEEVAAEFDKMKVFGDTAASFAIFVRGMKR